MLDIKKIWPHFLKSDTGYADESVEHLNSLTPEEINDGYCSFFSYAIVDAYGGEIRDNYDYGIEDTNDHSFVELNGKFYDAEALEGVDTPMELPFFKRALNESKSIVDKILREAVSLKEVVDLSHSVDYTGRNYQDKKGKVVYEYSFTVDGEEYLCWVTPDVEGGEMDYQGYGDGWYAIQFFRKNTHPVDAYDENVNNPRTVYTVLNTVFKIMINQLKITPKLFMQMNEPKRFNVYKSYLKKLGINFDTIPNTYLIIIKP
jgi:hypothetical protein